MPLDAEEDRRAWVHKHPEVVRLVKDCFGDRYSNNEIFDRLKLSRRTGYRALGNDERIGRTPGRKPKISEQTIKEMIEHIEAGGCNDVGNVWKHLADRFAPDCNPKTVQDAVKRSGFKNYRDPPEEEHSPDEEYQPRQKVLWQAIEGTHPDHVKYVLWNICTNIAEAEHAAFQALCPYAVQEGQATCRRCSMQYDPAQNSKEKQCLYHKGSPQQITPGDVGSIEQAPEAYIWSCCGGNGMVRGCCRAMHTTKTKRKGKKRDANEAELDQDKAGNLYSLLREMDKD